MRGLALAGCVLAWSSAGTAWAGPPVPSEVQWRLPALEFGEGAAAGLVVAPVTLKLAAWIGTWSADLSLALVPVGLLAWVVPPLVVAWSEWRLANTLHPGSGSLFHALWPALVTQAGALVLGILARVWVGNVGTLVAFAVLEAIVLPTASTTGLLLSRPSPLAPIASSSDGPAPSCVLFSF